MMNTILLSSTVVSKLSSVLILDLHVEYIQSLQLTQVSFCIFEVRFLLIPKCLVHHVPY